MADTQSMPVGEVRTSSNVRTSYASRPGDLRPGTLVELFTQAVGRWGDGVAYRHKVDGVWRSISYRRFAADVGKLARALAALGVEAGDRVALLSENRPEWALTDYATLSIGAIVVPVYPNLPAAQIWPLLREAGVKLVLVSGAQQLAKLTDIADRVPTCTGVLTFDRVTEPGPGVRALTDVLADHDATADVALEEMARRAAGIRPADVATIIFTSGTTGQPKGVMLTHGNLSSNVQACHDVLTFTREDTALSLLPLSHVFERMVDYLLFHVGCAVAFAESIERVPANLLEVHPTIVASVPRLYEKIYGEVMAVDGVLGPIVRWARDTAIHWAERETGGVRAGVAQRLQHALADRLVYRKVRAGAGGRIRFFISGGAPLNAQIGKFLYGAGLVVLEGYGLTETSPVTNLNPPDGVRFGTVGPPVPGTEERIAEDGEILIRGPQVMKGYYDMPEATRAAVDDDGWFHTGDVGELDADGYLRITDRKKDLIVTAGGKNIAPQPIESRIRKNRFVSEVVMLGDRRPYPVVLVVPDFGVTKAWAAAQGIVADGVAALLADPRVQQKVEQEVLGAVEEFARYERPKKVALLEQELSLDKGELTPTLKVRRRVVMEHYAALIDELYRMKPGDDVVAQRPGISVPLEGSDGAGGTDARGTSRGE
jgi:long-chain acyl-CoA synthetase